MIVTDQKGDQADPQSSSPGAPTAPARTTDRDLQRAALRDLVTLASECAATEAQIQQKHQAGLDAAQQKLQKTLSATEHRLQSLRQQIQQKYHEHLGKIGDSFQREAVQLKEMDAATRQRHHQDFEKTESEIKQKLQQATWLADSVLEATLNQLRDESNKSKRDLKTQNELLDSMETKAGELMMSYGVNIAALPEAPAPAAPPTDAKAAIADQQQLAERHMASLQKLALPRLVLGATPYIVMIVFLLLAAAGAQFHFGHGLPSGDQLRGLDLQWNKIGETVGITFGALLLMGVMIRFIGKSQAKKVYRPLREALAGSRNAAKLHADQLQANREMRRQHATKKRDMETQAARDKYLPLASKAGAIRDKSLATHVSDHGKRIGKNEFQRDQEVTRLNQWQASQLADAQNRSAQDTKAAHAAFEAETKQSDRDYQQSRANLEQRWRQGLAQIQAPIEEQEKSNRLISDWNDPTWKSWHPPTKFAPTIQFGKLEVDLKQITDKLPGVSSDSQLELPETFSLPALLAFPSQASLLIQHDRDGRADALRTLHMVMTRLLTNQPPGRVRFTIFDPVGLGQNFAGFMHLADWDEALVTGRIWTSSEHIEQRLANLTEHMETVIQKYLRNEFETIDEYNAQAGELAEPYRFLVIADFPVGFTDDSIRRLNSIAASGARCGVYTLIAHDRRAPLPQGVNLDDLEAHSVNLIQENSRFVWKDEVFRQFPLTLDPAPSEDRLTTILTEVGEAARSANRVEVSFDTIAPTDEEFFTEKADNDIHVPIGRMGATRLQMFRLGRGVAQHALVAGKTGSGKSTLLHALITNLAMWYSPDEIELYLVDFKKGVEFKTYATHHLPHARAIAVESDREFGLSVLQRIDAELARRGELFRKAGVQDLASYRKTPDAQIIPRTLLVIDEFQEFFSEDDKLAQDAAVLLDRLVRQGRAFGIHVLLGSQTIGGSGGLARSTIGQMAVRIALQTTEADSQLILGDNNSAARLLSRPGEAIYNDQGGLVEANSPFQVAWLPDERREAYLSKVLDRSRQFSDGHEPAAVFEGNAPADIRQNRKLAAMLATKVAKSQATTPIAFLGDPVAIKEPTGVAFRRQSGSNVLIVGQQDESAMALIVSAMISLSAQSTKSSCRFVIFDGSPADSHLASILPKMPSVLPNETKLIDYRAVPEAIHEIHTAMQRRLDEHDREAPAIYVIIYGLQRYRALRKSEESFSFSASDEEKPPQPDKEFADLLREGPPLGIHVIAWCDTPAAVERTLDRASMREFDNRILFQMSAADSSNLIDSPAANKLGFYRALAFSEEQGVLEKFRPYALPNQAWLMQIADQLNRDS